jgi:peptidoglycan/LPS O-acetylase OafA/YrhL
MPKRLLELDVLRGLAALAVVLFHYTTKYNELYGHSDALTLRFPNGIAGVFLFFIISGFVIFMTLERTKGPADFLVSRFSRLYPVFWVSVVLTYIVVAVFGLPGAEVRPRDAALNLAMFHEWAGIPSVDGVYWTLAVELKFYLLMWAAFCTGLLRRAEAFVGVWLTLAMGAWIAHPYVNPAAFKLFWALLIPEFAHLFAAGIIFYRLKTVGNSAVRHLLIAACMAAQFVVHGWEGLALAAPAFGLFYLFIWGRLSLITLTPLVYLGTISYALYLTHENIGFVVIRKLYTVTSEPIVILAVPIAVALGLASLLTFLVERPAMKAIRSFYKPRPEPTAAAPVLAPAVQPTES